MKVKIFEDQNGRLLEQKINEWLKENPKINIVRILQTEADAGITITILYY